MFGEISLGVSSDAIMGIILWIRNWYLFSIPYHLSNNRSITPTSLVG
jgi:hypothetical protein